MWHWVADLVSVCQRWSSPVPGCPGLCWCRWSLCPVVETRSRTHWSLVKPLPRTSCCTDLWGVIDLLIDWLVGWLIDLVDKLVDSLINWLICWFTDWFLIDAMLNNIHLYVGGHFVSICGGYRSGLDKIDDVTLASCRWMDFPIDMSTTLEVDEDSERRLLLTVTKRVSSGYMTWS